eukprot:CAMPEP_0182857510 /NCGR_PEP_ID=MMETSP0034_2-20130328/3086_1 /TAXON_ID=156128 /ORGANISM="Nephroselmis pyriformis, Strain CCMP717" /LENGTH=228 /DNA_ID=CAMNT_0024988751 /DNA_START=199 /DNA_END=885 /DNA_ORIENTATION=+
MSGLATNENLKGYMLKDLRILCREYGVNPAGGKEALIERLLEAQDAGEIQVAVGAKADIETNDNVRINNYARAEGQNVGNYMSDRPSSRVTHAPGGASQICFNDGSVPDAPVQHNNNYARAEGQNVGNFLTDRNSSRVIQAPGGGSQINFSDGSDYHASTDGVTGKPGQSHTPSRGSTPSGNVVGAPSGGTTNNYSRAEGQNVGNFITDRNSSRVLAPPGGASQITFG